MMKTTIFKKGLFVAALIFSAACSTPDASEEGLKDALKGKFYIGTAMNESQIIRNDTSSLSIIQTHFNSVVAENCMKSMYLQPKEGEFDFVLADKFVEFAEQNNMYTVGHCLIWHSQTPRWLFSDEQGNDVSRDVMIERMKTHISTVVGRYKGKVDAWDVVNEAFEDDGSWRKTKFYEIIGEEYMELAFKFAHEADPDASLLYNDYSMFHEGRRESVVKLVKDFMARGIPIDGVGMQAHYGFGHPALDELEKSIDAFAEAGADVHITELDINVLPVPASNRGAEISNNFEYQQMMDPYVNGLPDSVSIALNDRFLEFFEVFLKHQDQIKRVTLWGVTDLNSWKNDWPIHGRTNYPLLFDRNYQTKPAVEEIIKAAKNEKSKIPG